MTTDDEGTCTIPGHAASRYGRGCSSSVSTDGKASRGMRASSLGVVEAPNLIGSVRHITSVMVVDGYHYRQERAVCKCKDWRQQQ